MFLNWRRGTVDIDRIRFARGPFARGPVVISYWLSVISYELFQTIHCVDPFSKSIPLITNNG
jgi:hypothetical protein